LNLSQPEDNVNGFYAFVSESFQFRDESISVVILHKEVLDVEDMRYPGQMIVLSLLECGTKILVEEPAVPHFFHTHVNQMLHGIKDQEAHRAIRVSHDHNMNAIMLDPARVVKKYILNLPVGMKCQMGYMNPTTGRVLVGSMNLATQKIVFKNRLMTFTMSTVTYAIAIDDGDQKVVRKNPHVGNEAADFFARMSPPTDDV
jgi:hypothetical protein